MLRLGEHIHSPRRHELAGGEDHNLHPEIRRTSGNCTGVVAAGNLTPYPPGYQKIFLMAYAAN